MQGNEEREKRRGLPNWNLGSKSLYNEVFLYAVQRRHSHPPYSAGPGWCGERQAWAGLLTQLR